MKTVLIQLRPLLPGSTVRTDVFVASASSPEGYGLGGIAWQPALLRRPDVSQEIFSPDMDGQVQVGKAGFTVKLSEIEGLPVDPLLLMWKSAPVTIWSADDLDYAGRAVEFTGIVAAPTLDLDAKTVTLRCEASAAPLDRPLLYLSFDGSGGLGGSADMRGTLRPAGFGAVPFVEPVWFDQVNNVGQIDGYANTISITRLLEGGSDMGASVGDYASYAQLVAAIVAKQIPRGRWGTCLAQGLIGLGAPPAGVITADATFGFGTPGTLLYAVANSYAGVPAANIDQGSFQALDTALQALVGVVPPVQFWTGDQRQVLDLMQSLAASCNASPIVTLAGKVAVTRAIATGAAATVNRDGSSDPVALDWQAGEVMAPWWQLRARTNRPARTLSTDEVRYVNALTDRGLYNAVTVYAAGDIVWLNDKSQWLYTNGTPAAGNAPPTGQTSNAYWQQMQPATGAQYLNYQDGTPIESLKPAVPGATRNVYRGSYSAGTIYSVGDQVTDQSSVWVYTSSTPSAGNPPPTLPTQSNSYWSLFAQAGGGNGQDDVARAAIAKIQSDSILSAGEKPELKDRMARIGAQVTNLVSLAASIPAVSGLVSTLNAAYSNLTAFLNGLANNPAGNPAWDNTAGDTTLPDSFTLGTRFASYFSASEALEAQVTLATGQTIATDNRVRYSKFEKGLAGWQKRSDPNNIQNGPLFTDFFQGKYYLGMRAIPTAAGQYISLGNTTGVTPDYSFNVTPGERLCVVVGFQTYGPCASQQITVYGIASNGAEQAIATFTRPGAHPYDDKMSGFFSVPAGYTRARIEMYAFSSAAGDANNKLDMAISEPMVCAVSTLQQSPPSFIAGPDAEAGADQTGLNTAKDTNAVGGTPSSTVLSDVATAKATAQTASQNAATAKQFADDVADNTKFSADEKKRWYDQINTWAGSGSGSVSGIVGQLNSYGLTAQSSSLSASWSNFFALLQALNYGTWTTTTFSSVGSSRNDFLSRARTFSDALQASADALTNLQQTVIQRNAANIFTDAALERLPNNFSSNKDWSGMTILGGGYEYSGDSPRMHWTQQSWLYSQQVVVGEGDAINVSIDLYMTSAFNGTFCIYVQSFDTNGGTITFNSPIRQDTGNTQLFTWKNYAGRAVLPANCAKARVYIQSEFQSAGDVYWRYPYAEIVPTNLAPSAYIAQGSLQANGVQASYIGPNQINLNNFQIDFGGGRYQTISGGAISGLSPSTTYYIYLYAPNFSDNGRSFSVSTLFYSNTDPNRIFLGAFRTADNGGGGGGTGSTGTGGSKFCVAVSSWLRDGLRAGDVAPGSEIDVLSTINRDALEPALVEGVIFATAECVTLVSSSGVSMTCSTTTPMERRDGSAFFAPDALHEMVFVDDEHGSRWEPCIAVLRAGVRGVAKISVGRRVYMAGDKRGARMASHNIAVDKDY